MRRLTLALLYGAYLCLALIVALSLWRNGGGWGAAVAALVGGLGFAFALHGMIMRGADQASSLRELARIRQAQNLLLDQVERVDARVSELMETVGEQALRRSEELAGEVEMLEGLVRRMSERLDERGPAQQHLGGRFVREHPSSTALLDSVRSALAENRVDLYLQPVVTLPQRRTQYYESFSRLRDETGRVMMPAEYLTVAEPGGLVTAIDNLLLFRCVQIVRRLAKQDRKVGIFCNISRASLADDTFFPQFLELLSSNRDLADALIFELGQAAFQDRGSLEARNMAKLADLGFRFSLDKVADLDLDLQDLARSDVKFVRVGAQMLLDEMIEVDGRVVLKSLPDLAAEDYSALARRYGVEVIAEKIENERQVVDILELNIAMGQGHLFGEPRPIRDQVLHEADPPADFLRGPLRRGAGLRTGMAGG